MTSRRRSLSASRTLDQTVNFVGRIGASLRLPSRKRNTTKNALQQNQLEVQQRLAQLTQLNFTNPTLRNSYSYQPNDCLSPAAQKRLLHKHLSSNSNQNTEQTFCTVLSPLVIRCGGDKQSLEFDSNNIPISGDSHNIVGSNFNYSKSDTLRQQMKRRYIKEGAAQLTSISDLLTHHRYLFLFNDLLLVSKQKGENSYKLKEKVLLEKIWISSITSCSSSFLIGYPSAHSISNYVAHFSSEKEKAEWFEVLNQHILRKRTNKSTTISIAVKIEGRQQIIRKEIQNGISSTEVVAELVKELDLPVATNYELGFETHASGITIFNGIENVYAVLMDVASKSGAILSESQLAHLDVCPLVTVRLVLRITSASKSTTASYLKTQLKKVLSRPESKRLFGKELEGSMPPQPILTLIDHIFLHGINTEGVFRKSPKMGTVQQLKSQLDNGQVPDFTQHSVHCSASLLKEYLRSIPGNLLLNGNYHLWMDVVSEKNHEKRLNSCKSLLKLLPPSHSVLLRSVLRLLRRIALSPNTKMNVESLAVCIAPGLLWNDSDSLSAGQNVPKLAEFLIRNTPELFDDFTEDGPLLPQKLAQSTDSGLSDDSENQRRSITPDSLLLLESPFSDVSGTTSESPTRIHIEEIPSSNCANVTEIRKNKNTIDDERTPVVSRENSQKTGDFSLTNKYQWKSHLHRTSPGEQSYSNQMSHSPLSFKSSLASVENDLRDLSPISRTISYDHNTKRFINIGPCDSSNSSSIISSPEIQIKPDIFSSGEVINSHGINNLSSNKYRENRGYYSGYKHQKIDSSDSTKTLTESRPNSITCIGKDYGYSSSSISSSSTTNKSSYSKKPVGQANSLNWKSSVNRSTFQPRTFDVPSNYKFKESPSNESLLLTKMSSINNDSNWKGQDNPGKANNLLTSSITSPQAVKISSITAHKPLRRPPPRTAPEIQLSPLEVNWSVTSLRTAFQNNDSKPASIDTIYVSRDMLSTINAQ
ncbi:Rho GTPase-activating protein domain and Pleckstrin homology domain and Rho GTPase activation protein domain and Pleckstrin homology-like domain-containing protein [Strongyloides ratti]|uniref:Rho GTPase-activating protein domain and Pleckstrin homology domain and Rho GTPase activation protein domain and Pleckstrin homology-like domain-containing protein n=1 Tax=Strongyloides ratti TaxID=34506 RepID=A0A090MY30_STRRB|nr:Rho GTPase-activating protein domain and Pleckstrin homology domain and Rho GTPase activation protein domain and Pleckstrin homology-like domain-containing protein [Strongyloides ratti]CEF66469.1 Rho GTPase-activating protein domain and Pleckstrin homology domain and Rho GTPase activation protein domain and Pleckstrin homology-like domain-containing protein [Strongyloides ratti]